MIGLPSGMTFCRRRAQGEPLDTGTGAGDASFPTGVASEITSVSRDRLQSWHQKGLLIPSIAGPEVHAPRRGVWGRRPGSTGRRYSLDDLVLALLIRELLASGVSLERVRHAVETLRTMFADAPLYESFSGSRFRLVVPRSGAVRLLPGDQAWRVAGERFPAIVALARTARTARELLTEWQRRRRARDRFHPRRGPAWVARHAAN